MRRFLNSISADAKNLIFNLGGGIIWFLSISMTIVVGSNPIATSICKIVGGVTLMIAAFLQFVGIIEEYFIKEDEMFIAHIKEAKARTLDIVVGGLIWYCVTATFLKIFFGFNFWCVQCNDKYL